MKKYNDNNYLLNPNLNLDKKNFLGNLKTTNINVLLNRVKVEKKNDLKKKIFHSSLMFMVISLLSFIIISI